jgi:hypothetical protein
VSPPPILSLPGAAIIDKFSQLSDKSTGGSDDCISAGITELSSKVSNDDRIFDLMGRELVEVPLGVLYIKNRKLYVSN